jgi:drug/metabolite transporter (DMT)-like permease
MLAGILLGLGASASWALANVVVQRASRAVGSIPALLWAQVLGILMVIVFSAAFDGPGAKVSAETMLWVLVAGAAGLLAYVCLFYGLEHGRLTVAVPIMSSWAVISSGLSLLLFDQRVTGGQLAGAAAVVVGAVVVSRHAHKESVASAGQATGRWLLASFGAAIGFGVGVPAMARLVPTFGNVGTVGVVYAADMVLGLPLALAFRIPLTRPRGRSWLPVFLAGLFETSGFVCITLASRVAPLALVSPVSSLAAPITVLYAWVILRERPPRPVLIGVVLVCAGVVALAL